MIPRPANAVNDAKQWNVGAFALGVLLVVGTFVAYAPSLRGEFLWDDSDYVVNNPALRSARGLLVMWTNLRALPQWYPMVHSSYWLEHRLFGMDALVFRLNNLLLHIATALLLWRLLLKLQVPGAYLAALIFALHPVHVESVAWITERKNTLSGLFYIGAMLAYWKFWSATRACEVGHCDPCPPSTPLTNGDRTRRAFYWLAFTLFLSALLSKTVTASFPAAVLVIIWWKAGRVKISDVKPLTPFFIAGLAMGCVTAYLEQYHVGARGVEWDYAPGWVGELAARTLIAGRALWFYAAKLLWPDPLAFMYERWSIHPADWTQWFAPVGAVLLVVVAILLRRRLGRGPVAALLLFGGTLLPALGFFNVFPHRYSFVADHFQYLASIALTTLLAATAATSIARVGNRHAVCLLHTLLVLVIGSVLGALSFRQSRIYLTSESLWLDTIEKSPRSWVACVHLASIYHHRGDHGKAFEYHRRAVELAPHVADTWSSLAIAYAVQEKWDQAIDAFTRARDISRSSGKLSAVYLDATVALGRIAFLQRADVVTAERYLLEALAARPDYTPALLYLAALHEHTGRTDAAIEKYRHAIATDPNSFDARFGLGSLLLKLERFDEAASHLLIATANRPRSAEAWSSLGWAQLQMGNRDRAVEAFSRALSINPQNQQARQGLAQSRALR